MSATLSPTHPHGPTQAAEPATLPALLLARAAERGAAVALRHKRRGRWEEITWEHYADRVAAVAAGLRALGVGPGDRVAVHAENRPEWVIADLAVQGIGARTVGIYPTSPAAEVRHLLAHSGAVVLIAEDEEQLDKTLSVRAELPALRHLVVIDPRGIHDTAGATLHEFADLARPGPDARAEYARSVAALDPDDAAVLVYTSGTTGPPKGAMLSHRNLAVAGAAFAHQFGATGRDELLSYLPLCHVAERLMSLAQALHSGCVTNFGEGGPSFAADLRDVQPTIFLGVPRVWEKLLAGVEIRMADATRLKGALYRSLLARARDAVRRGDGVRRGSGVLGDLLVFRALREKLGLSRVRYGLSGAAPIAAEVLEFLWAVGVPVREAYGQTENTALCTFMPEHDVRLGTVGVALPGVELRIADDGEICTRSAGVFLGYLDDPAATAATVDPDGWLHTGDVGELDADGFLRITDRKKDIIITAGGKNVSPSEIENRLKVSPYIREAVVIGDGRRYLTALIGIEGDTVGDWATRRGLSFTTYADLSGKPEVVELVDGVVARTNAEFAQVETVKRFTLMAKELDHEDGELTATQKVKRGALAKAFATEIEAMYERGSAR